MDNALVLDTSGYIAILSGDHQVTAYIQQTDHIFVPTIVIGELIYGYHKGKQYYENYQILQSFLSNPRVALIAIDTAIAERYGALKNLQQQSGDILAENDLWIAAACLYLKQPLLTFDSDFFRIADVEFEMMPV